MRRVIVLVATLALLLIGVTPSHADLLYTHSGSIDPTTEGFTGSEVVGPASTTGPLTNDQGLPAWFIAGSGQSSQYAYFSPALTASQQAEIVSQGFTMTVVARVLQNGLAPPYTTSDPVRIGAADVSYGGVRWELDLALNSNGDTVVILPNTIAASGPGGSVQTFGASYTLTGSGSTYHTFQLFYNPTTMVADLSVDGVTRLTGYTGETSFVGTEALAFAATSGGQGNFNLVQVQTGPASVPEPSTAIVASFGAVAFLAYGWSRHRRQQRRQAAA
jgi:hypothetical protein